MCQRSEELFGAKAVDESRKVGLEFEEAEGKLRRGQMTKLDILQNQLAEDCGLFWALASTGT